MNPDNSVEGSYTDESKTIKWEHLMPTDVYIRGYHDRLKPRQLKLGLQVEVRILTSGSKKLAFRFGGRVIKIKPQTEGETEVGLSISTENQPRPAKIPLNAEGEIMFRSEHGYSPSGYLFIESESIDPNQAVDSEQVEVSEPLAS